MDSDVEGCREFSYESQEAPLCTGSAEFRQNSIEQDSLSTLCALLLGEHTNCLLPWWTGSFKLLDHLLWSIELLLFCKLLAVRTLETRSSTAHAS